jgi:hypothetical protein
MELQAIPQTTVTAAPAAKKIPVPSISDTVWYFRRGQMDRTPITGIVTNNDRGAVLELSLIPPMARTFETVTGVRHCSDPYLATHPNVKEESGVWDFVNHKIPVEADQPSEAGKDMSDEEIKSKVLELYERFEHDATRVAQEMAKLTGEFSYQRVNAIVRNSGEKSK